MDTKAKLTKTRVQNLLSSPRVKTILYAGASLCTTLCYVAMMSPKRPEASGE